MKNVVVNGACGNMGKEVVKYIFNSNKARLTGAFDRNYVGENIFELIGIKGIEVLIKNDLEEIINEKDVDVIIDFTSPTVVMDNIKITLNNNINMIVGTTGITDVDLKKIKRLSEINDSNIIIAPNFSIGAVLMMEFSRKVAKYMDDVEIIEMHHDNKVDSPSGTSLMTAEKIAKNINKRKESEINYIEQLDSVRGGQKDGITIHSVRLRGLVAHQQVIFGSEGQTLTIKHDIYDRSSFMVGLGIALDNIDNIEGLVYGLEHFIN
ncbi:MAG: 4-hydroxy-tetrahydrodipicolinate reductase [Halanaerobiales bacterium]